MNVDFLNTILLVCPYPVHMPVFRVCGATTQIDRIDEALIHGEEILAIASFGLLVRSNTVIA